MSDYELPSDAIEIRSASNDPDHVDDFRTKSHYPEEVADQWDEIRAGQCVYVDEKGNEVDGLSDAYVVLHPSYAMDGMPSSLSGIGPDDLPPVTTHHVGRPDERIEEQKQTEWKNVYAEWVDPDTGHAMVTGLDEDGEVVDVDINKVYADDEE